MRKIYFDNAATTPLDPQVIRVMADALAHLYGNPSSIHTEGRKAKNELEQARKRVAAHINAAPAEVVFTSGGTEANNMAIKCAVNDLGVERVISTPIEHHCVSHTVDRVATKGVEIAILEVCCDGLIKIDELRELLTKSDKKTLVSIMYANNEIGSIMPVQEIAELCREHGALFHSDTVQAVGHFPIDVQTWPVDFISAAAHKFHGPKGVGFLYINPDIMIKPMIDGGDQERKMRAGTENIYGIIGLASALDLAIEHMASRRQHIESLVHRFCQRLSDIHPDVQFNGCSQNRLYTVLSVSFPPMDQSAMLLMKLDLKGIYVSAGSACSSGSSQPSHVIQTIRPDDGYTTVRFSFSHQNTMEEVDYVADELAAMLKTPEMA